MKQVYLVGGAVRDKLLGRPVAERDWVVVGSSPDAMEADGYKPVGKDFPVFLHPTTGEEYALARTERKSGHGYSGFTFYTSPDISLEEDLSRRDLTINAMAETEAGEIIDPYSGLDDLNNRLLRHVSPAFGEDPVRILRVARFAARYHHLGFRIAPETLALMQQMVDDGEVEHLVAERVWKEMERALQEQSPHVFIESLRSCGALRVILPEVDSLFGVPQPAQHHPEIDCGVHTLLSLQIARALCEDSEVLFATLVHDLGKATTPEDKLPQHIAHEARSKALIDGLCARLAVPKHHRDLAIAVATDHTNCHRALELKPGTLLKLLKRLDYLRRPHRVQKFLLCCTADARGRTGYESCAYRQAEYLQAAAECCASVSVSDIPPGTKGKAIGEAMDAIRLQRLSELKQEYRL